MAQDTTKQQQSKQQPGQGSTAEGGASPRERYGPSEHYGSGSNQGNQGSQYGTGSAAGQGQGSLSQRNPVWGEGRGMTPSRGGAMSPYGGYANPFELMQRMTDEMDRIFESFGFGPSLFGRGQGGRSMTPFGNMGNWGGGAGGLAQLWSPRIEVFEREGRLVVEADLPGVRKEDLSVQIEQDAIVIQGQRRQEQTSNERGYYHSERSYGSFHRSIPLPEGADADNARARFRDGVLEVEVPIQQRSRGRTLEIQDARGEPGGRTYEGGTAQAGGSTVAAGSHQASTTGVSGGGATGGRAGSV